MITTASFRNDIKHNMSREEICAKYKISEEELTHFINANYLSPNTRKFVNRMLKTNDKRNTRKTNHSRESVEVESMSCEDVETAEVVAMTDAETDHLSDVITLESLQVVTLEDLIEEEKLKLAIKRL